MLYILIKEVLLWNLYPKINIWIEKHQNSYNEFKHINNYFSDFETVNFSAIRTSFFLKLIKKKKKNDETQGQIRSNRIIN